MGQPKSGIPDSPGRFSSSSTSQTSSLAACLFWLANSDHNGEAGRADLFLRQLGRLLISTTNTTILTATSSLLQLQLQGSLRGLWKALLPLRRPQWLLLWARRIWCWTSLLSMQLWAKCKTLTRLWHSPPDLPLWTPSLSLWQHFFVNIALFNDGCLDVVHENRPS